MHPFSVLLARLILGSIWLVAAAAKFAQREDAERTVAEFDVLPPRAAALFGRVLPWIEATLSVLLLAGAATVASALASMALLLLFTTAITINLARGRRIECNCFGQIGRSRIGWPTVARNVGLIILAALIVVGANGYVAMDGLWRGTWPGASDPSLIEFVPVLLLTLMIGMTWIVLAATWKTRRLLSNIGDGAFSGWGERWLSKIHEHR